MKSDILTPSQVEEIEKLMILGQATQKDGVQLVNSHRALQRQVETFEKTAAKEFDELLDWMSS